MRLTFYLVLALLIGMCMVIDAQLFGPGAGEVED